LHSLTKGQAESISVTVNLILEIPLLYLPNVPSMSCKTTKSSLLYFLPIIFILLVSTYQIPLQELFTVNNDVVSPLPLPSNSTVLELFVRDKVILLPLPHFNVEKFKRTGVQPNARAVKVSNGNQTRESRVCGCAKCGSSALGSELYRILFGNPWPYSNWPFVNMDSKRWKGLATRTTKWKNFQRWPSFALIRDPKERLMSAFRSKVRCQGQGTDSSDRKKLVPQLLKLARLSKKSASKPLDGPGLCLNETSYLQALYMIHKKKLQGKLDPHFLPQHLNCFLNAPPSNWTVVTTIGSAKAICDLELVVLGKSEGKNCLSVKKHATNSKPKKLSTIDEARLDAITREEYLIFGSYLD